MAYLFIFVIPFIIYLLMVSMSIQGEKEERERKNQKDLRRWHVQHIRKTYPNAFEAYWCKPDLANSVFKDYSNVILNENSINWTEKQWRVLEDDLIQKKEEKRQYEIRRKMWLLNQLEEIRKQCPNGFKEYKKRNPASTEQDAVLYAENIVIDRELIELLENEYNNSQKTNIIAEKILTVDGIIKERNLYVIISIEPFVKVLDFDGTILVKVNKVIPTIVNDRIIGHNYSKEEDENTRWIVFKDTENNLQKLLFFAKECERGHFWVPDLMILRPTWVDYFDLDKKKDVSHRVEVETTGFVTNKE